MAERHDYLEKPLLDHENEAQDQEFEVPDSPRLERRLWIRRNAKPILAHLALVLLYTTVFIVAQTYWRASLREPDLLSPSPANRAIKYEQVVFNAAPHLTSPYVGESRPSLDKAWHNLLNYTNLRISSQDLEQVNRTSIPLGVGGGYYGEMAVFHELHCLKFMRRAFHLDYYNDSYGQREHETMGEHIEHCVEILRQGVMCRGDTTLITFGWVPKIKLPQPDFTLKHKCVNWDQLMDWARDNAINVFEEGMLMHPTLGPSYPGGHRDDRPQPSVAADSIS